MNTNEARRNARHAGTKGVSAIDAHEIVAARESFEHVLEALAEIDDDGDGDGGQR